MFILNRQYTGTAFVCLAAWGMIETEAHAQHGARSQHTPVAHHTPVAARPHHTPMPTGPKRGGPSGQKGPVGQKGTSSREADRRSPRDAATLRKGMPSADRRIFRAPNSEDIMERGRRRRWDDDRRPHRPWWREFGLWGGLPIAPSLPPVAAAPPSVSSPGGDSSAGQAELSSIIQAQGQYLKYEQEARVLKAQADEEREKARRSKFDVDQYISERTPTTEDNREEAMRTKLRRSLNNPPITEIHSGEALNSVLDYMKVLSDGALARARARLDADALAHINVAGGKGNSLAIFKNGGRLDWTSALKDAAFDKEREQLEDLAEESFRAVERGRTIERASIKAMTKDVDELEAALKRRGTDFAPSEYIAAKRYLRALDTALNTLARGDACDASREARRCRTVAELVKHMSGSGLRFDAALPGDEDAYVALHTTLVSACERVVPELTSTR